MKIGDKVQWVKTTQRGKSINMRQYYGKIVDIDGKKIIVKKENGRKETFNDDEIGLATKPGLLTEFMGLVKEGNKQ